MCSSDLDNEAGYGANEISLLVSATEAHTKKNLNATRDEQWRNIAAMAAAAKGRFRLVGTVSMAFGCPFEGKVDPGAVVDDVERFRSLGVELVALADTIGAATPLAVRDLFSLVLWAASFTGRTVRWGRHRFVVDGWGRLARR